MWRTFLFEKRDHDCHEASNAGPVPGGDVGDGRANINSATTAGLVVRRVSSAIPSIDGNYAANFCALPRDTLVWNLRRGHQ